MFTRVSTKQQIEQVKSLAAEIWTEHYVPIIGRKQVDYMLERFQSARAIAEQIENGHLYFLIGENDRYVGYVGVQPKGHELFLSKIYIQSSERCKGYGRKAIDFISNLARDKGLGKIVLTVNKNNVSSIRAYERIGFKRTGALVQEIGAGFIMDDYKMEKDLRREC